MYQFFIPNLGIILPVYYRRYKLASSVNLYRFTHLRRFPQRGNLRKLFVGEASPIPFDCHLGCRLRIYSEYFLVTDFFAICIEVQFSINEK